MTVLTSRSASGWAIVALQGLLFAGIAFWPRAWSPTISTVLWLSLTLVIIGAAGVVASAVHLGQALTPLPEPNGAGMVARGVYAWARHPMYTALVIICAGVAVGRGAVVAWVLVGALAVFFDVKSRVEERYLLITYDGYAEYARTTGKFLPWVGKRKRFPSEA